MRPYENDKELVIEVNDYSSLVEKTNVLLVPKSFRLWLTLAIFQTCCRILSKK